MQCNSSDHPCKRNRCTRYPRIWSVYAHGNAAPNVTNNYNGLGKLIERKNPGVKQQKFTFEIP